MGSRWAPIVTPLRSAFFRLSLWRYCRHLQRSAPCANSQLREVQTNQRLEAISDFDSSNGMAALPSWNGCRGPVSAARDPEQALANVPRRGASCPSLIGVHVYSSGAGW